MFLLLHSFWHINKFTSTKFQIKKCSRVTNSIYAHAWRTFLSFVLSTLSKSMRQAKFLSCPILFESGWNWNLKFEFLGEYGQKTIFQTKWTRNTDKLKIYLVWFSSTVWRGQLALKFSHKILEKKTLQNIYVIFTSFQLKIIYMSTSVSSGSFVLFQAFFALL